MSRNPSIKYLLDDKPEFPRWISAPGNEDAFNAYVGIGSAFNMSTFQQIVYLFNTYLSTIAIVAPPAAMVVDDQKHNVEAPLSVIKKPTHHAIIHEAIKSATSAVDRVYKAHLKIESNKSYFQKHSDADTVPNFCKRTFKFEAPLKLALNPEIDAALQAAEKIGEKARLTALLHLQDALLEQNLKDRTSIVETLKTQLASHMLILFPDEENLRVSEMKTAVDLFQKLASKTVKKLDIAQHVEKERQLLKIANAAALKLKAEADKAALTQEEILGLLIAARVKKELKEKSKQPQTRGRSRVRADDIDTDISKPSAKEPSTQPKKNRKGSKKPVAKSKAKSQSPVSILKKPTERKVSNRGRDNSRGKKAGKGKGNRASSPSPTRGSSSDSEKSKKTSKSPNSRGRSKSRHPKKDKK